MDTVRESKWDRAFFFIGALIAAKGVETSLRIGSGATVPVSYVQYRARTLFAAVLYRLVPATTSDLFQNEAFVIVDNLRKDMDEWGPPPAMRATPATVQQLTPPQDEPPWEAAAALCDYLDAWQDRWNLPDHWLHGSAMLTLIVAKSRYRCTGHSYMGPLSISGFSASVHDGKRHHELWNPETRKYTWHPDHELIDIPVSVYALCPQSMTADDGWVSDDALGTFDPRTETVDSATRRMLPEIEQRLRNALNAIVDDDRAWNDAVPPVAYRSEKAFERLVRFQVLGKSRKKIAKEDGVAYQNVSTQVNETARLIGLTLRDDKGDPE